MSSNVVKAGKWLLSLFMGGAGGWSWLLWIGLGASTVGGAVWWHSGAVDDAAEAARAAGAAGVQQQWDQAENAALRESQREVSRLVAVNLEVQGAYNKVLGRLADADAGRAAGAGLRDAERTDIVDAAGRATAGTCARYAALCERHVAGAESDAEQMGRLAVRATAGVDALRRTLRERNAVRSRQVRTDQIQPE